MELKHILLFLIIFVCSSVSGQNPTNTPTHNPKVLAEKIQTLASNTQEQFLQVQKQNQELGVHLHKMENEIALYREDVRTETSKMNTNMSHWLAILTGIMTILGVIAPIAINIWNNRQYEKKLRELQVQIDKANKDAQSAKSDADSARADMKIIAELKSQIDVIKQQTEEFAGSAKDSLDVVQTLKNDVDAIKQEVDKNRERSHRAAKRAIASKLFAEALSEHNKNPQRAIELYTDIIKLDNTNVAAYNNRGSLRRQIGAIDGAMEDFNKAIGLDPNNAISYNNRGNLKQQLNDEDGAMSDYDRAIELNGNNDSAHNNKADLLMKLGELSKALSEVNKAIELDDSKYEFFITKGEIYKEMKQYDSAVEEFTHALSLKQDIKDAYKFRAECYRALVSNEQDKDKREEYIVYAEADEDKYKKLS